MYDLCTCGKPLFPLASDSMVAMGAVCRGEHTLRPAPASAADRRVLVAPEQAGAGCRKEVMPNGPSDRVPARSASRGEVGGARRGAIHLTLPYPPSTNHLYAQVGNRRMLSKAGKAYKTIVRAIAAESCVQPFCGPVGVRLRVYRPRRTGDLANREKILIDALNGYAFRDDSLIVELHMERHEDKAAPRVEVEVWEAVEGSEVRDV